MKKFFSKIAQRAFALAISIMVVTNTFAQGAAGKGNEIQSGDHYSQGEAVFYGRNQM